MAKVYAALHRAGCAYQSGEDFECPAHDDNRASLGVAAGTKGAPVVLFCAAGCKPGAILKALGLGWADLGAAAKVTKWTYRDETGKALVIVTRRDMPDGSKQFFQSDAKGNGSVKNVRKVLYGLPELREVCGDGGAVYLVEGEKSVDALQALKPFLEGKVRATTALAGAAQAWRDEYTWSLRGASKVVIIADNDRAGMERARTVHDELERVRKGGTILIDGKSRTVKLGPVSVAMSQTDEDHDDIVEHLADGGTLRTLVQIPRQLLDNMLATVKEEEVAAQADAGRAYTGAADHESRVAARLQHLRADEDARLRLRAERRSAGELPSIRNLRDFLAVEDNDAQYVVESLFPVGARILLTAAFKAGKTTLIGNLVRSFVDGCPFLGRFATRPVRRVVLIDDELDERTMRRWLREFDISKKSRVDVISLRGQVSAFEIMTAEGRSRWAQHIGPADVLILDCLRPVLDAAGLDENHDAGRFLLCFDALLAECGISEAVVVHHMGHGSERARGDSRLRDWADAEWKLVRQTASKGADDPGAKRYFSAYGRDVDVQEGELIYRPEARTLSLADGSRSEGRVAALVQSVVAAVSQNPGCPQSHLEALVNGRAEHVRAARDKAVADGLIRVEQQGNKRAHYPAEVVESSPRPKSSGRERSTRPLVL